MAQVTKPELEAQFENAKNTYVLGLAAISLFAESWCHDHLEKSHCEFGGYKVPFNQVASLLRNSPDRDIAVKEYLKSHLRALIKESFELLKNYCESTNQSQQLKSENWYQFARMIRNCISHNFHFEFNKHDKTKLPVVWHARTIDISMDKKPLELAFFGYKEAWELFDTMHTFAKGMK